MPRPTTDAKVTVSPDGPYVVTGDVPLMEMTIGTDTEGGSETWEQGETRPTRAKYMLCRCGHSKTKPFCDGTHATVGFDGAETAERVNFLSQAGAIERPALALLDAERLCAFGRFCDTHGSVWNEVAQSDDPEVRSRIVRQVGDCPSGRLVVWDPTTEKTLEPDLPVSIGLVEDPAEQCSGPLWLRGGIAVVSADGFEYEVRNRVTLCRCGASQNKPFCDGSHAAIKFHAK